MPVHHTWSLLLLPHILPLLQCGSLPGGAVLQEQAAPAQNLCEATNLVSKLAPTWAPLSMAHKSCRNLLQGGLPTGSQPSVRHPPALEWAAGGSLPSQGPPWLQGHSSLTMVCTMDCREISAPVREHLLPLYGNLLYVLVGMGIWCQKLDLMILEVFTALMILQFYDSLTLVFTGL